MTPSALRRLALGALAPAVLVVGLAACGESNASRDDVQKELEEGGASEAQASCITDYLFDNLDQDQINKLYESDTAEEAGDEVVEATDAAIEECADA